MGFSLQLSNAQRRHRTPSKWRLRINSPPRHLRWESQGVARLARAARVRERVGTRYKPFY